MNSVKFVCIFLKVLSLANFVVANKKNAAILEPTLNLASSVFDAVCSSTLPLHNALQTQSPDISKMSFQLMTPCRNYSVPLEEAQKLIYIKGVSRSKMFVFFAPGWRNTFENSNTIVEMAEAFFCRKDVNFVAVDFDSYMDTKYKWAAINTAEVGAAIGISLAKLVKLVPISNIYLVGHSLGAQIMGAAGRSFKIVTNGKLIPRITGLDPAKPCFGSESMLSGLNKGDARLVDIIHTNSGVLGVRQPIGHIDFYPSGFTSTQNGCSTPDCSHARAPKYWIESIFPGNQRNFPAKKCANLQALLTRNCRNSPVVMGFKLNSIKPGIFYVDVNAKAPFGRLPNARQKCQRQLC